MNSANFFAIKPASTQFEINSFHCAATEGSYIQHPLIGSVTMDQSAFGHLQAACASQKIKSIRELDDGVFKIDSFRLMQTKYGLRLIIVIQREMAFLPARFAKNITSEQQVDELNAKEYIMEYGGYLNGNALINFREITQ